MLEQKLTEESVTSLRFTSPVHQVDAPRRLYSRIAGLHHKVKTLSEGEYAAAKSDVDRLRQELGQQPLPSLQNLLEEKTSA